MRTSGVVFVMFHPDEAALANLAHARSECSRTVVVDNTPRPDEALHERLRADGVWLIANRNVAGLAGAYNRGVEWLLERGVDLCFFLDQDSEIDAGYVDRMTAAADTLTDAAFLLGPLVYEIRMDRYFPPDAAPSEPGDPSPIRPTHTLISSGSAVSVEAYTKLGAFWEELFIEYVDTEYAVRAARQGVPVLMNTAEVLRQYTGDMTRHGDRFTTNHVAWRRYYLVRNVIASGRAYGKLAPTVFWGVGLTLREAGVVVLHERDKLRKVVAILVGSLDGFRRRLGAFEHVHPRVQRYCSR